MLSIAKNEAKIFKENLRVFSERKVFHEIYLSLQQTTAQRSVAPLYKLKSEIKNYKFCPSEISI
jgi:hypothetical protein